MDSRNKTTERGSDKMPRFTTPTNVSRPLPQRFGTNCLSGVPPTQRGLPRQKYLYLFNDNMSISQIKVFLEIVFVGRVLGWFQC